jgi:hypothetical protein
MAKSNVYIKSGLWKKTDKPVKGELSLDAVINTVVGTPGIPQLEVILTDGIFGSNTVANPIARTKVPVPETNTLEIVNFWNATIDTDAEGVIIPNTSYFISISTDILLANNLTSFSVPDLITSTDSIYIAGNTLLTTVNIGEIGTVKNLASVGFENNALSEETVNYILALLVSLDGTNGTALWNNQVNLSGGTSAAPTGQGLIDKQTLIDRGADEVITN